MFGLWPGFVNTHMIDLLTTADAGREWLPHVAAGLAQVAPAASRTASSLMGLPPSPRFLPAAKVRKAPRWPGSSVNFSPSSML